MQHTTNENHTSLLARPKARNRVQSSQCICLTAFGAGESYHQLPFHYKCIALPLLMRQLYIDHNLQEDSIRNSKLDWTVIRPVNLTEGAYTGKYQHGESLPKKTIRFKISRADTADFMIQQLTGSHYLHAFPEISY